MLDTLIWLLALLVASFVGVPAAMFMFRRLPSAGSFLIKPLGVLAVGYLAWLFLFTGLFTNGRVYQTAVLFVAVAAAAAILKLRPELARAARAQLPRIAVGEAIFAAAFVAFAIFRARNPDIIATEKPMEFALLNGILRSESFPPADPWLSGFSVNYYYFGYSIAATFTAITATAPAVGFNLALAMTFALTFLGMLSLGYDVTGLVRGAASRARWGFGALTAFLATAGGNLYAINFFFGERNRSPDFWRGIGWNASRAVQVENADGLADYTISEFPAFSFLLGDLHPHVMALPFSIASIALAVVWLITWSRADPGGRDSWLFAGISGWLLGSLYALNAWDSPVFFALTALAGIAAILKNRRAVTAKNVLGFAGRLGLAAIVGVAAYLPFHLNFDPFAFGLGFVTIRSEIGDFLVVHGLWALLALVIIVVHLARGGDRGRLLLAAAGIWLTAVLAGDWDVSALLLCLLIVAGMAVVFGRKSEGPGGDAIQFLYFAGFGLAAIPELIFIRDFFGPPYQRMNTVFKIYYQAWPILAAASGPAIYVIFRELAKLRYKRRLASELAFSAILAALIFVAMSYSAIAGNARVPHKPRPTLDGLDFVRRQNPQEIRAVEWLKSNAPAGSVIVEATGNGYGESGRVSAWTGIPAVIGWEQHERLWRKNDPEVRARVADMDSLYRGLPRDGALAILRRYGASHVYVGRLEREKYGPGVDDAFGWMTVAYEIPGYVTIYKVPGT